MEAWAPSPDSPRFGSEAELQQRLSRVLPTDSARGFLFNSVLEVVRQLGGETAVRRCLEIGGERKFVDLFNYSSATFIKTLYTAGWLLSDSQGSFEQVLRRMGRQSTANFVSSTVGKTLLLMAWEGPQQMLKGVPAALRLALGGMEFDARMTGANSGVIIYKRDTIPPPYVASGFLAVFEVMNLKGLEVSTRQVDSLALEYKISWE